MVNDPVRAFEHTHEHLTKRAAEAAEIIRGAATRPLTDDQRARLRGSLEELRDDLLQHFAVEEEGLFPFIRAQVPARAPIVERLALAHDAICGSVVRLAHAAATAQSEAAIHALPSLFDRFQAAYVTHSREEAELFAELGKSLEPHQREALATILRGL